MPGASPAERVARSPNLNAVTGGQALWYFIQILRARRNIMPRIYTIIFLAVASWAIVFGFGWLIWSLLT